MLVLVLGTEADEFDDDDDEDELDDDRNDMFCRIGLNVDLRVFEIISNS